MPAASRQPSSGAAIRVEAPRLEDPGRPAVQFASRELIDDIEAVARKLSCDVTVTFDPGPRVDLSRG